MKKNINIIQFGEGNFLRAFADWIINRMNTNIDFDGKIGIIQPISNGTVDILIEQQFNYHVILKGINNGCEERTIEKVTCIIDAVNPYTDYAKYKQLYMSKSLRFVISNTTEAGITFNKSDEINKLPNSFPAKVTKLLLERYITKLNGLIFLPCELIDSNGDKLLECIERYIDLWNLGEKFKHWINTECVFCNTLVDRIVPGFPRDRENEIWEKIGKIDDLIVEGEYFHLWVIEAPRSVRKEFPADKAGLNIIFTNSIKEYRDRKVTILNGAHTILSSIGYLYGLRNVREVMQHEVVGKYIKDIMFNELPSSLTINSNEISSYTDQVIERFNNPFIDHQLSSIMLNAFSKFKTRDIPSLKAYYNKKGSLPRGIVLGLSAIIAYYKLYDANDSPEIIKTLKEIFKTNNNLAIACEVIDNPIFFESELKDINGLKELIASNLKKIETVGIKSIIS